MRDTRKADLAKIHIGRKQLGLDDVDYRALLDGLFGKDSAGKLNQRERWRLICRLEELGAELTHRDRPRSQPHPEIREDFYEIPDHVPHAQLKRYVAALWKLLGYKLSGLDVRASKQAGVDRFLWIKDARVLSTMAKDLYNRARKRGLNPEPW